MVSGLAKLHVAAIAVNDMPVDTASKVDHGSCHDLDLGRVVAEKLAFKFYGDEM